MSRIIAAMPAKERSETLAQASMASTWVMVEHSWQRKLSEADHVIGEVIGITTIDGGGCSIGLVLRKRGERVLVTLPASRILRIRAVHYPWSDRDDEWKNRARIGAVLAGPPLQKGVE